MANNYYNNENVPNHRLYDLLMQADLIIMQYDMEGEVNYQELSDIIHEISVDPRVNDLMNNDPSIAATLEQLHEIQDALAPGAIYANGGPQIGHQDHAVAPQPAPLVNRYVNIPYQGTISVPKNKTNVVSLNNIANRDRMINFQGERGFGRYYKKSTFNQLATNNQGFKKNPVTRALIHPGVNMYTYNANVSNNSNENLRKINTTLFTDGGKRRKTRKTRKAKKTRKNRKH
jgi:hypothetical protein